MDNNFESKVFNWFGIGLLVTFVVAYLVSTSEYMISLLYGSSLMLVICLVEVVLAIILSVRINKLSKGMATGLYLGYTALTGLTFSSIFLSYDISSIIWVFLASAVVFLVFALIGKITKINLSGLGIYLVILLLAVIILGIINIFLASGVLDMGLCIISLLIFVGYVAYDMQRVKYLSNSGIDSDNVAIICAFNIYLDFINIFIELLRLFGKGKD